MNVYLGVAHTRNNLIFEIVRRTIRPAAAGYRRFRNWKIYPLRFSLVSLFYYLSLFSHLGHDIKSIDSKLFCSSLVQIDEMYHFAQHVVLNPIST